MKGEVLLASLKSIAPFSQTRRECGIELTTESRVWVLVTDTPEAKVSWVAAISKASQVEPDTVEFGDSFKGWLWKLDKGSVFKRQHFVLVRDKPLGEGSSQLKQVGQLDAETGAQMTMRIGPPLPQA